MFGYRNLGFGSHPNRTSPVLDVDFTTTVTIGTNNTKSGHYSYGYDTASIHDDNAIGSVSGGTQITNMVFNAARGSSDNIQFIRLVYHAIDGGTNTFRIKIEDGDGEVGSNLIQDSNIEEGTITVGSTVYTFGEETYNGACGAAGSQGDHSWADASNPMGTSGTVVIRIQT